MRRRFTWTLLLACSCTLFAAFPGGRGAAAPDGPETQPPATLPSISYLALDAPATMSQAVIVEGLPLVHTRQLLPLDRQGQLVGGGSAERQIGQVLLNLHRVLQAAGSGLDKLVKLNIYADSPQAAELLCWRLSQRTLGAARPATTAVVTPLAVPGARVAVDAVAVAARKDNQDPHAVTLLQCDTVTRSPDGADAALMPPGGVVYLSGQPDKSPRIQAVGKSLTALLETLGQLGRQPSDVVQLKVFIDSPAAAEEVRHEVKRHFPGQLAPPATFVQWIASAPIEIEMVAHLPPSEANPDEPVRYYTPPGVEPSPTFSRVAVVQTERQVYIGGLSARVGGDGQTQVRDVFDQLKRILLETDSDFRHLAKATYYVSDEDASRMLNQLRPEYYDPDRPPAASKVTVRGVARPGRSLTMDMIAVGSGR